METLVWEHRFRNKQEELWTRGHGDSINIARWATKSISVIIVVIRNVDTKTSRGDTVVTRQRWGITTRGLRMNSWKTLTRYRWSSGWNRKLSGWRSSSGILAFVHIGGIAITIDAVIAGVRTAVPGVRGVGHKHDSQADQKRICSPGAERGVTIKEVKRSEREIECDETKVETLQSFWKQSVKRPHEGNREL